MLSRKLRPIFMMTGMVISNNDKLFQILSFQRLAGYFCQSNGEVNKLESKVIGVCFFQCLRTTESCCSEMMALFIKGSRNGTVHMIDPVCSGKPHPHLC